MQHPDLRALWSIAEKLAQPRDEVSGVFESIGLILTKPGRDGGRYHNTPPRAHVFAGTGGDGVHFSLVEVETPAGMTVPVVMTVPMASDEPNHVVGESLRNFLSLGCCFGYSPWSNWRTTARRQSKQSSGRSQKTCLPGSAACWLNCGASFGWNHGNTSDSGWQN